MARERKTDARTDGKITPRHLAAEFLPGDERGPYKVRKVLRTGADRMSHAKNSRWAFKPDGDEIAVARELLTAAFGDE